MHEEDSSDFMPILWNELADFDAARSDAAPVHLMGGLCTFTLARAWNAVWPISDSRIGPDAL